MADRTHSPKAVAQPDELVDLSMASLSQAIRDIGDRNAHVVLDEIRQSWRDNKDQFTQKIDHLNQMGIEKNDLDWISAQRGIELAEKIPPLCDALLLMVKPVLINPAQQLAVREMLTRLASQQPSTLLPDMGDSSLAVLQIAIYIGTAGR